MILSFTRWCIAPDMEFARGDAGAMRRVTSRTPTRNPVAYKNIIGTILVRRTPFLPEEAEALVQAAKDRE